MKLNLACCSNIIWRWQFEWVKDESPNRKLGLNDRWILNQYRKKNFLKYESVSQLIVVEQIVKLQHQFRAFFCCFIVLIPIWRFTIKLTQDYRIVRNGFWLLILSDESCKLSANSSKESEDWLGDRYKEMKLDNLTPIKISKIKHSCR